MARAALATHAQDVYREALASAWRPWDGDERAAHRVAWLAIKRIYVK